LELVFATHNRHKLAEITALAGSKFIIKSLADIGFEGDIPETADSFLGNARQKVQTIYQYKPCNCFADDTGLVVEALDGRPGVFSARYAGENATYQDNVKKLLQELEGISNRKASFITIVALILNGKEHFFEGRIDGEIITEQRGDKGFGYDPIFVPHKHRLTFAEMNDDEKNGMSHRGIAVKKMFDFLSH
jgi:XTP/dITP diphosphohydrolase